MLITAGERKATALLCMALHDARRPGRQLHRQPGRVHHRQQPHQRQDRRGAPRPAPRPLEAGRVPVVGGAQGVSGDRNVTFLGRGGSDTTAVALAHALDADSCELYTDVSGVFTADPRLVPRRPPDGPVSFDELLEMTATGCPKPAMRSVEFARTRGVRLHVRSAFTWEPGTWVQEEDPSMEQAVVSAVVHDTSEAKVTVSRRARPARHRRPAVPPAGRPADVNVDMIVQNVSDHGVTDISFTVPHEDLETSREVTAVAGRRDRGHRRLHRRRHRAGEPRRRRHEVEPGRGRHHVRDAGRRRHQHRDDLDVGHPHLLRRPGGRGRAGRPGAPRRVPASTCVPPHRIPVARRPWVRRSLARHARRDLRRHRPGRRRDASVLRRAGVPRRRAAALRLGPLGRPHAALRRPGTDRRGRGARAASPASTSRCSRPARPRRGRSPPASPPPAPSSSTTPRRGAWTPTCRWWCPRSTATRSTTSPRASSPTPTARPWSPCRC